MMKVESKAYGELKLVFPTETYKEQIEGYLKEHFERWKKLQRFWIALK